MNFWPRQKTNPSVDMRNLTPLQLMRIRFTKHKLARGAFYLLQVMYLVALLAEFFAPYPAQWRNLDFSYCPPQFPRFSLSRGLYVNAVEKHTDPVTFEKKYVVDKNTIVDISLLAPSKAYKLWGVIPLHRHFLGMDQTEIRESNLTIEAHSKKSFYLLGADKYGRDILSRIIFGARISLFIGIVAIMVTFFLGLLIGGISGYFGGKIDTFIQRLIEIINAVPKLPLWLAFGAIIPADWSPLKIYFAITLVLSFLGWTNLARVVRGKLLTLREEDYAMAAYLIGASRKRIILRHLLPGFTSHIIVAITLTIPWMILGETSLSFLGLGLRPPVVSWGVMLQDCINMTAIAKYPWLLMPVVFIILTVLSFNFLGDGLRDAADPYSGR